MVFRRLSDNEIRDIVAKSTTAANNRLSAVRNARSPQALAGLGGSRSGGGGGGGRQATPPKIAQSTYDKLREAGRKKLEVSGFGWLGAIDDVLRAVNPIGAATIDNVGRELLTEMPDDETPQNLTQGVLNFLSGGLYATARATRGIGEATAAAQERIGQAQDRGDALGVAGEYGRGVGEGVANVVGGAARGLAEGLGFRFDGERPLTQGQNLEQIGANDDLREQISNIGGDEGWQNFGVGAAGLGADIASDPFTYVAGTGLVRAGGAAARAASDALRAGTRNPIRLAGVAGRAGAQGRRDAVRELAEARASRKAARAQQKLGTQNLSVNEYTQENSVAAAVMAAREAAIAREAQMQEVRVDQGMSAPAEQAPTPEPTNVAPLLDELTPEQAAPAAGPDLSAFDASVQGMETLPSQAAPADVVLQQTYQGVIERGFDGTVLQRLSAALRGAKATPSKAYDKFDDPDGYTAQRELQLELEGAAPASPKQAPGGRQISDAINEAVTELRRTPEGRQLLRTDTGSVSANKLSVTTFEAALRAAAYTAGTRSQVADVIDRMMGLNGAPLDRATGTAITPEAVGQALVAALGKKRAKKFDPVALADELGKLETDEQRMQVLARVLTLPGRKIKSFDDAMEAAMKSQLGASEMRMLLKTLKIRTEARTPKGLQAALAGKGAKTWQEIKSQTPTEAEVLDSHGVTPDVAAAADDVDIDAMQANAAETEAELSAEIFDGDPQAAPLLFTATDEELIEAEKLVGTAVGDEVFSDSSMTRGALAAMVKAVRDLFSDGPADAKYVERFDQDEWLVGHRAGLQVMRAAANRLKLRGRQRADFLFRRLMDAHRAYTSRMLASGRVPRLQHQFDEGDIEPPLYASIDQLLDLLPEDTAKRAMFSLDYRVSEPGEGATAAAQAAFKKGITVYPTTIARAAISAIRGKNADEIFAAMNNPGKRAGNDFEGTPEGQAVMREIAEHYAQPEIAAQLKLLHDAQELAAVAIAKRAVDTVVGDLARNIIRALGRRSAGGDRSLVMAEIEAAILAAARLADEGTQSLIRDMAQERLANGVLAMLGEPGVMLARADARLKAAREAVYGKNPKPYDGPGRSAHAREQERKMREAVGRSQTQTIQEFDSLANDAADARIAAGEYEATDLGRIEALADVWFEQGAYQVFGRVGVALRGSHGMDDLKPLQVARTSGLYNSTELFSGMMNRWVTGGKIGDTLGVGGQRVDSLGARLAADVGARGELPVEQVNEFVKGWWTALARHEEALESAGLPVSDDALRAMLARGQSRDELTGRLEVAPLSPAQIDMAIELREIIRDTFDGPLSRTPVLASDLSYQLQKLGFKEGGDLSGAERFKDDLPLAEQTKLWRDYDMTAVGHPLDALLRTHGALTRAQVKADVARSMTAMFGHRFAAGNKSIDELKAEGWKRLDTTQDDTFLSRYIDPDAYFPPEIVRQLPYLEKFFKDMDKAEIAELGSTIMRNIVRPYDLATGVVKSSQTIWNPAHHITNVLGENFSLMMAGVDPSWVVGSPAVIRAGGKMLDADMTPIDVYRQQTAPIGREAATGIASRRDRMASGESRVALVSGKNVDLSPEDIWKLAVDNGVAVTARHSKDLIPGLSDDAAGFATSRWARFTSHRLNLLARADRRIGEFSAVRDNLTRIAHFRAALEARQFRSVEEAVAYASKQVHSYHPTIQTLSADEQKVARRLVMYYTWVRQMAGRVILTALEQPALVTLPSKIMYNQAEAAGLEPESFGKPVPDDPRIASYYEEGALGPSWFGGYAPFSSVDELPRDRKTGEMVEPQMWGMSLNSPQADALFTLFGGINADEGPMESYWKYLAMANVFLKIPQELGMDSRVGGIGAAPSSDYANYLLSQTGAPYRVAGALGLRESKFEGAEAEGDQQRLALNYLTGLKFTNYTNSTAASVAKRELGENEREYLEGLGFTEGEIKEIRKMWKQAREQE